MYTRDIKPARPNYQHTEPEHGQVGHIQTGHSKTGHAKTEHEQNRILKMVAYRDRYEEQYTQKTREWEHLKNGPSPVDFDRAEQLLNDFIEIAKHIKSTHQFNAWQHVVSIAQRILRDYGDDGDLWWRVAYHGIHITSVLQDVLQQRRGASIENRGENKSENKSGNAGEQTQRDSAKPILQLLTHHSYDHYRQFYRLSQRNWQANAQTAAYALLTEKRAGSPTSNLPIPNWIAYLEAHEFELLYQKLQTMTSILLATQISGQHVTKNASQHQEPQTKTWALLQMSGVLVNLVTMARYAIGYDTLQQLMQGQLEVDASVLRTYQNLWPELAHMATLATHGMHSSAATTPQPDQDTVFNQLAALVSTSDAHPNDGSGAAYIQQQIDDALYQLQIVGLMAMNEQAQWQAMLPHPSFGTFRGSFGTILIRSWSETRLQYARQHWLRQHDDTLHEIILDADPSVFQKSMQHQRFEAGYMALRWLTCATSQEMLVLYGQYNNEDSFLQTLTETQHALYLSLLKEEGDSASVGVTADAVPTATLAEMIQGLENKYIAIIPQFSPAAAPLTTAFSTLYSPVAGKESEKEAEKEAGNRRHLEIESAHCCDRCSHAIPWGWIPFCPVCGKETNIIQHLSSKEEPATEPVRQPTPVSSVVSSIDPIYPDFGTEEPLQEEGLVPYVDMAYLEPISTIQVPRKDRRYRKTLTAVVSGLILISAILFGRDSIRSLFSPSMMGNSIDNQAAAVLNSTEAVPAATPTITQAADEPDNLLEQATVIVISASSLDETETAPETRTLTEPETRTRPANQGELPAVEVARLANTPTSPNAMSQVDPDVALSRQIRTQGTLATISTVVPPTNRVLDETGTDETGTNETGTDETGADETGTDEAASEPIVVVESQETPSDADSAATEGSAAEDSATEDKTHSVAEAVVPPLTLNLGTDAIADFTEEPILVSIRTKEESNAATTSDTSSVGLTQTNLEIMLDTNVPLQSLTIDIAVDTTQAAHLGNVESSPASESLLRTIQRSPSASTQNPLAPNGMLDIAEQVFSKSLLDSLSQSTPAQSQVAYALTYPLQMVEPTLVSLAGSYPAVMTIISKDILERDLIKDIPLSELVFCLEAESTVTQSIWSDPVIDDAKEVAELQPGTQVCLTGWVTCQNAFFELGGFMSRRVPYRAYRTYWRDASSERQIIDGWLYDNFDFDKMTQLTSADPDLYPDINFDANHLSGQIPIPEQSRCELN
ncbi:MAG: hypothetical protein AAF639_21155 [Chloroflexota bacterium]